MKKQTSNNSSVYSKLYSIGMPIMIQNFISASLNFVDIFMIGSLGTIPIAAVGIANQVFLIFSYFITGSQGGCFVYTAQYYGKGDTNSIKGIMSFSCRLILLFGSLFTIGGMFLPRTIIGIFNTDAEVIKLGTQYLQIVAISYIPTAIVFAYSGMLRAIGDTKYTMYISIISILLNTGLNYLFIFGHMGLPALGVVGAAIATLIARLVQCLAILIYVYKKTDILSISINQLIFNTNKVINSSIIKVGIPIFITEVIWVMSVSVYVKIYGLVSVDALSATQIAATMASVFHIIAQSVAYSTATIVGNALGEGDKEKGESYAYKLFIIGLSVGIVCCLILAWIGPIVGGLFNISEKAMENLTIIIRINAVMLIFRAMTSVNIMGIFRAGGDTKFSMYVDTLPLCLLGIPVAYLAAKWGYSITVVMIIVAAEEAIRCGLCIARLVSGKWVNILVKGDPASV